MKLLKLFLSILGLVVVFIVYLFYNLLNFESKQVKVETISPIEISDLAVKHLSEAIQIKTISTDNSNEIDTSEFDKFNQFITNTYPLTDSLLEKKIINSYSHLYTWKGSDPSLKPIVIMGHIDVVPVLNENKWTESPFKGTITDDMIWGRGTLDDKISVIGVLESIELLLKEGFIPKRTIYLAFGHDEEIGGNYGALVIAKYLEIENIKAEFVLDEGMTITQGLVPDLEKDVALIGIAEKGVVSLELSVEIEGGHSSMPAKETAIDVISNAITKLKANPFPAKLSKPITGFIDYLGPEMPFPNNLIFANASLFENVITGIYEKKNSGNALVRTTTSPTIFNSGIKVNIIPQKASAVVNFRILPSETIETVTTRIQTVINDNRIHLSKIGFESDPSAVSSIDAFGFQTIQKSIHEIYGDILVAPSLVVGATDSKHFKNISENIYRFAPIHINEGNITSFHGVDERISIKEFKDAVRFYRQIFINSCSN